MNGERENFKAGLFVLGGIILAAVALFLVTDFRGVFVAEHIFTVRYAVADGLHGLREGSAVTLGDQPIGEVLSVEQIVEPSDTGPRIVALQAQFSIPQSVRLYQNARLELVAPLLGSGTRLNISSVGSGAPLDAATPIDGALARNPMVGELVEAVGLREEEKQRIRDIIANVATASHTAKEDLPKLSGQAQNLFTKAEPIVDDAKLAMADLRESSANVKGALADVQDRSAVWKDRADSVLTKADDTMTQIKDAVEQAKPGAIESVENVRAVTAQFREKTMAEIETAIAKADASLENLKITSADIRTLMSSQRPVIERALANAHLTSEQLKLASIEVRRSPWRLLYTPKEKELETDNLYDAARSFAMAASALDSAVHGLKALSVDEARDPEDVQRMLDYLEKLVGRFEEAETDFWAALKKQGK
jgi:ABC-type transporter Mla subunit MlaD